MHQTIESHPARIETICANPYFLFLGLTLKRPHNVQLWRKPDGDHCGNAVAVPIP